jgi:methylenetetrahydromethanopterin dehydrogenase
VSQVVKIGVVKVGCIGTLPLIEFLLDERAERTDIDVRVAGSGAKLGPEQCREATSWMIKQKPDLVLLIGPAQQTRGPTEARGMLTEAGIPTIVISDGPTKGIAKELEEASLGYIIILADSMIGARREFLDPLEMALYNSDILKVLAATGVLNVVVREIDDVIQSLKREEKPNLPRIIVDKEKALEAAGFKNPYAKAKAMAAHEISRHVAELNVEACFKVEEWTKYVPLTAAGHEMMRTAAKLADEAREIEKSGDSVLRKPHHKDGSIGEKRALIEKPKGT